MRELDPPEELWTRWAALATALTAAGHPDVWEIREDSAVFDDQGGQWARLILIEGSRAVLYGGDHEYSDTIMADPPIDLLAGAPDWLPWDDLLRFAGEEILGYVYWHDGAGWGRAEYDTHDGLDQTAGPVLSDAAVLAEVRRWVKADVDATLLVAARERRPDPPRVAPGWRPTTRQVRRLSEDEHERLIWDAMRTTPERPRSEPARTAELDAVRAWARERGPVEFMMTDTSSSGGGRGLPFDDYRRLSDMVRALRKAEFDPHHGSWLFLRVDAGAAQRHYDSWPDWWDGQGPGRYDLVNELAGRTPKWRPAWSELLDDAVAMEERP